MTLSEDNLRKTVDRILQMKTYEDLNIAYRKLRDDPDATAGAILLQLLASGDVTHSPRASHTLALRKAVTLLEKIKEIREQLPSRTGLADYRFYVDRDIKILQALQSGASCHCDCYPGMGGYSSAYSPERESDEGFVEIMSSTFENNEGRYDCKCLICGRQWLVLEDPMGYHYTVWQWTEQPSAEIAKEQK